MLEEVDKKRICLTLEREPTCLGRGRRRRTTSKASTGQFWVKKTNTGMTQKAYSYFKSTDNRKKDRLFHSEKRRMQTKRREQYRNEKETERDVKHQGASIPYRRKPFCCLVMKHQTNSWVPSPMGRGKCLCKLSKRIRDLPVLLGSAWYLARLFLYVSVLFLIFRQPSSSLSSPLLVCTLLI